MLNTEAHIQNLDLTHPLSDITPLTQSFRYSLISIQHDICAFFYTHVVNEQRDDCLYIQGNGDFTAF